MEKINHKNQITNEAVNYNNKNGNHSRTINKIVDSQTTTEGGGFVVHRPFPTNLFSDFDPFLLLDEMGPMDLKPGEAKGAPDHPHRGFETVTYMLSGNFEHKDSQGHSGKLNPGDVQWMTAGSGVVHSEMPAKTIVDEGGILHGFQLWVNLPKKDKMIKPFYQDISSSKIPIVQLPSGKGQIKVIAGKYKETESIINTKIPILYLHIIIEPGAYVKIPVNAEYNVFAYVITGHGIFNEELKSEKESVSAKKGQMVIFNKDGDSVTIKASENTTETLKVLLIGGTPLNEPIARYGPFVMNTKQEVYQAIEDYRNGRLGIISH